MCLNCYKCWFASGAEVYFCEDCTGSMFKCPNSSPGSPPLSLPQLSLSLWLQNFAGQTSLHSPHWFIRTSKRKSEKVTNLLEKSERKSKALFVLSSSCNITNKRFPLLIFPPTSTGSLCNLFQISLHRTLVLVNFSIRL